LKFLLVMTDLLARVEIRHSLGASLLMGHPASVFTVSSGTGTNFLTTGHQFFHASSRSHVVSVSHGFMRIKRSTGQVI
jgi:hypothetical protein